jgi:thiosulfate/3-mercaptopyruvate sulfurtransferase
MLDDLGHERVVVLDGGWPAWLAAGGAVSTDVPAFPPARLHVRDRWDARDRPRRLRPRLGEVVLLDARGAARYRGETEPIDAYPGHIPTARSAPRPTRTWRRPAPSCPPPSLPPRYAALGADGSAGDVVTSCGSGVSACHDALAMRIAGVAAPLLYPGSYSDWTPWPAGRNGPDPGTSLADLRVRIRIPSSRSQMLQRSGHSPNLNQVWKPTIIEFDAGLPDLCAGQPRP